MPFRFFTALFLLPALSISAQETKHFTRVFTRSSQVSQSYYALKSNKYIMHGQYVSYFRVPGKHYREIRNIPDSVEHYVWKRGVYVNGKKHGEWVEYSAPGVLYAKGVYDMDKKTGLWLTSRENGEVLEKYDHTTRQKQVPEIRIPLKYPPKAREAGVRGTVVIEYRLQADCSVGDPKITQSLGADCDKEALKNLLKFYGYLKKYGPPNGCEAKTDTFIVKFNLE